MGQLLGADGPRCREPAKLYKIPALSVIVAAPQFPAIPPSLHPIDSTLRCPLLLHQSLHQEYAEENPDNLDAFNSRETSELAGQDGEGLICGHEKPPEEAQPS